MAVPVDSRLTCIQATVASALPGLPIGPTLEAKRSKTSSLRLRPRAQESANIRFLARACQTTASRIEKRLQRAVCIADCKLD